MKFATIFGMASECYYNGEKILRNTSTSCRISHSGGAWGAGGGAPPILIFFEPLPIKTNAPHGAHPPLKNEAPPAPPLKSKAPFHEMIPRKSTTNNNLKSS